MSGECDEHAWASLGVVEDDDSVGRIWVCERCSAWTREPLLPQREVDWEQTDLAAR